MGRRGPTPTGTAQRRNATGEQSITDPPPVEYPELPGAEMYLSQTIAWYEMWATSPQAAVFAASDWSRLHMVAALVDQYWQKPSKDLMAEIRQNESKLGGTIEDRQRLRMKVEKPKDPGEPEKPAPTPSRAKRDPRKK